MNLNRAYSILHIKAMKEEERVVEGIASTPTLDRVGDIVRPMGAQFSVPMPLLLDHDSRQSVGHVEFAKPNKEGIPFRARIASTDEPGEVKNLLDKAWHLVKLKLRSAVSIGFTIDKYEIMKSGGWDISEWSWLELSLVTIPANADCTITTIKSLDAERLAASGHKPLSERTVSAGVTARKFTPVVKAMEAKSMKKTYADQIAAFEATRAAKAAEMDKLMDDAAEKGETLDAAGRESYDTLDGEVKSIDDHLVRLRSAQERSVKQAVAVAGDTAEAGSDSRRNVSIIQVRNPMPKGVGFVRLLAARFMAKEQGVHPAEIAASRSWGDEIVSILRMPKDVILKAAVAPATTTDATWAAPLAVYQNLQNEFIALMRARSIIDRIPGLRRVPFMVKIPRETTSLTAYWVGQGSPKPVSKAAFDTVTLDFAKVAGITLMTQELLRFSTPNAETLLVDSLTKAITYLVDRDFLDPTKTAVTGVSPASVTNGSSVVPSTGSTADAFRNDFANLMAKFSLANYTLSGLVLIMTETQAMRLSLMRNDFGAREFPDISKEGGSVEGVPVVASENIVATGGSPADGSIIVAMNAMDVLLADDGAVDVDVSTEASLQANDSPDSPTTATTVLVSLWQNNLVGIRCERFINWIKARTDSVVYISNANYKSM